MEEFAIGKRIRPDSEKEESVKNAVKSESNYSKKRKSDDDDGDKNQLQVELKTKKEKCYGFPSSSKEESITGKRVREGDEINLSLKKMKSEPDIKKDSESDEDKSENQDMRIRKEEAHFLRLLTNVLNAIMKNM